MPKHTVEVDPILMLMTGEWFYWAGLDGRRFPDDESGGFGGQFLHALDALEQLDEQLGRTEFLRVSAEERGRLNRFMDASRLKDVAWDTIE